MKFARGYAYYRVNKFLQALNDFSACIKIEPSWALAYYNRGIGIYRENILTIILRMSLISGCTYYQLNKLDEALYDVSKSIKYDGKNKVYLDSRAILLREMGRFREAIQDYKKLEGMNIINLRQNSCDASSRPRTESHSTAFHNQFVDHNTAEDLVAALLRAVKFCIDCIEDIFTNICMFE